MKVIVRFGEVKVLVPCGDGQVLVKDLIERSISRFMKVTNRNDPENVKVSYLTVADYGGILDPDDVLTDVVDDKEQLIAEFTDLATPSAITNTSTNNTNTSTSTATSGRTTPTRPSNTVTNNHSDVPMQPTTDVTNTSNNAAQPQSGEHNALESIASHMGIRAEVTRSLRRSTPTHSRSGSLSSLQKAAVTVTREQLDAAASQPESSVRQPAPLSVRRDSENNLVDDTSSKPPDNAAAPVVVTTKLPPPKLPKPVITTPTHSHSASQPVGMSDGFERALSGRQSLGATASMRWLMAQQQAEEREAEALAADKSDSEEPNAEPQVETLRVENNGRQLGIQVVPYYDEARKLELGFEVDSVIEGKRVYIEKLLAVGDRIVAINGQSLTGMHYELAQDTFCKALRQPLLELGIIRAASASRKDDEEQHQPQLQPQTQTQSPEEVSNSRTAKGEREPVIQRANVKKIGSLHTIELTKTTESLGFSLTTRDTNVSNETLIYVKHIVAGGIAHRDGRLQVGDRLLEVNGVDVSDRSQLDVVAMLRAAPINSQLRLVISRQVEVTPAPAPTAAAAVTPASAAPVSAPQILPASATPMLAALSAESSSAAAIPTAEVLKFDVPLNPDSNSDANTRERQAAVGLGVSVKGRTLQFEQSNGGSSRDLGIFVKSIVDGGAAQRDGRLRIDDRLIEVNGASLLNLSNTDAMIALKRAISMNAQRTVCSLTVIRTWNANAVASMSEQADAIDSARQRATPSVSRATPNNSGDELERTDADPFARDAVGRHSISEKRHPKRDAAPIVRPFDTARRAATNEPLRPPSNPPPPSAAPVLHNAATGVNGYVVDANANANANQNQNQNYGMMAMKRTGSLDSLQRAIDYSESLPSESSSNRGFAPVVSNNTNVQSSPNQEFGHIAPLELDHEVAVQLAKTRGSTDSFRIAVDRSIGDSKPSRLKADKTKKVERDKAAPPQPSEQSSLFAFWKKKKQAEMNAAAAGRTEVPQQHMRSQSAAFLENPNASMSEQPFGVQPIANQVQPKATASPAPAPASNMSISISNLSASAAFMPSQSGPIGPNDMTMPQKAPVRSNEERLRQIQREYQKQHRDQPERLGIEGGSGPVRAQLPATIVVQPQQQPVRPKAGVPIAAMQPQQPAYIKSSSQVNYVAPAPAPLRPLPAGVAVPQTNARQSASAVSLRANPSPPAAASMPAYRQPAILSISSQAAGSKPNNYGLVNGNGNVQMQRPPAPPKYEQAQAYSAMARQPVNMNVSLSHQQPQPQQMRGAPMAQGTNYRQLPAAAPNGYQQPMRPTQPPAYNNPPSVYIGPDSNANNYYGARIPNSTNYSNSSYKSNMPVQPPIDSRYPAMQSIAQAQRYS